MTIVTPKHSVGTRALIAAASMLVALGLTVSAGATAARADDTDGIAGAPATNGGVDQSRSRFSYQVEPGQKIKDEYFVQNTGTTEQTVTVYSTDAFNADDGSFSLLDGAAEPTDVGTWISFKGGEREVTATLDPGESKVIPFTVDTPADAGPGDHAGGILVSAKSPAGQVTVDRRVAIRLYVRVAGDLQPALSIGSISASYAPELNPLSGETTMTFTITNTGNVALGANSVSQVRGIFGIPLSGLTKEEIPEMLPGSTRVVTVTVDGVGPWLYLNPQVALAATIDDEAMNPGVLPSSSRGADLLVVPWGILLVLIIAGLIWLVIRLRRNSDSKRATAWIEYTEAEARRKAQEQDVAAQ